MNAKSARVWLVNASLLVIAAEFVFFLVAPAVGYPLGFAQAMRLLEVMTPTFFGYLGSATHFLFATNPLQTIRRDAAQLFPVLVRGPVLLFGLISSVVLVVFGYTNRAAAPAGGGMDIDMLALIFSLALSLLAVTTTVLFGYLFGSREA